MKKNFFWQLGACPPFKFLLTVVFFWIFIFQLSILSPFASGATTFALAVSAVLTLVYVCLPPIRSFLCRLPAAHLLVLVGIFFLFEAGHHLPGGKRAVFFPFVQWSMFGRAESTSQVTYFEYVGIRPDGSRVVLNPTRLFPPLRHARLSAAIWTRLTKTEVSSEGKLEKPLEDLLLAVGRAHNRAYPEQPITSIEIIRNTMDLAGSARPPVEKKPIARLSLPSGGDVR